MQVFLHRNTNEEECYLNVKMRQMAIQNKNTGEMKIKFDIPQVVIDRYYADAIAGINGWEIVYAYDSDNQTKYTI